MSEFKQGSGKWFLGALFSGYLFAIWGMLSLIYGLSSNHWSMAWLCLILALLFYFALVLAWYRKKEQLYKTASISKWCDNITFLNDKGTVSIRQDRITEIIDLNTSAAAIESITKKEPDYLRIKVSLIADSKALNEEFDMYKDEGLEETDELIEKLKIFDEKHLLDIVGEKDPLQFKYKYFRVSNIVEPNYKYIPIVSRKPASIFSTAFKKGKNVKIKPGDEIEEDAEGDMKFELGEIEEKIDALQAELDEIEDKDPAKATSIKKEIVRLIGRQTELKTKLSISVVDKPSEDKVDVDELPDDVEGEGDGADVDKDDAGDEDDADPTAPGEVGDDEDESVAIDGEEEGEDDSKKPEDSIEEIDIDDAKKPASNSLDTYKYVDEKWYNRIVGNFKKVPGTVGKGFKKMFTHYIYRIFETNDILSVLDDNEIDTVEKLRNADKVKLAKQIGFTNAEMKEFVKYVENGTKEKEYGFWKDLIPEEYRKFILIKMVATQMKNPQYYVYLITFAEPIEFIVPKNVIARPFLDVEEKPRLMDEAIEAVTRKFEQAIYILPDKFEACMNFLPGGSGNLEGYEVSVPMTYATFVLKGWMTNNIPILKAIATSYEVNREMDDYKNFLSHELTVLKAMVGYVNHIKSNTNLLNEQVEYTNKELESMQDQMDAQRQMRLHQMYFKSGGFVSPDAVEEMMGTTNEPAPVQGKKGTTYVLGFAVILLLVILLFVFLMK